jgi:ribonuclease P protein component
VGQTLKKSEILKGRKNFERVFASGKKFNGKYLRCLVLASGLDGSSGAKKVLFAVAVSRTLKKATDRNRIKRLVRESYRRNKQLITPEESELPHPVAVVFVYSSKSERMPSFNEIQEDVRSILRSVSEAGLKDRT